MQENGASLQAMDILPAITHNRENKESVFSKKPGGRVFFMDLLHLFLRIFDEFFSGFRAKFQKRVTPFAFSIKFAKTN